VGTRAFTLRLGGLRLRLRADGDARLLNLLQVLNVAPAAATARADLDLTWTRSRGGELRYEGRLVYRSRSREDLVEECEWYATTAALRRLRSTSTLLHAAWVSRRGRGVLIAGRHGAGKTSLAAALALRHGWALHGDDVAILSPSGTPRALERPLRIKPGSGRRLPELRSGRRTELVPLAGISAPANVRLRVVVLLRGKSGRLRMTRPAAGLATAALVKATLGFNDGPARTLKTLAGLTARVPVWVLSGGTLDERCAALGSLV
jgi:hypothetical protein